MRVLRTGVVAATTATTPQVSPAHASLSHPFPRMQGGHHPLRSAGQGHCGHLHRRGAHPTGVPAHASPAAPGKVRPKRGRAGEGVGTGDTQHHTLHAPACQPYATHHAWAVVGGAAAWGAVACMGGPTWCHHPHPFAPHPSFTLATPTHISAPCATLPYTTLPPPTPPPNHHRPQAHPPTGPPQVRQHAARGHPHRRHGHARALAGVRVVHAVQVHQLLQL